MVSITLLEALIRSDPCNPVHHIALARAYLERGDEERARKVIAIKRRLPSKDPAVHFEWGALCEELGMAKQAIESYEQAIALNPNRGEYHFKVAQLFYERGAWERAVKHLQRVLNVDPQHSKAKEMLASLYEEMGMRGLSEKLYPLKGQKATVSPSQAIHFTREDIQILKTLFQGKEVGYADLQMDGKGNLHPIYFPRPWGEDELRRHLQGEMLLGIYPLRSDKTLKFASIHIRIPNRRLFANIKNQGFLALTEDHLHSYTKAIYNVIKGYGIPNYLENFGGRGRRLWFFFEEFIPCDLAERFLQEVLDKVPSPGVDLTIDLLLGTKGTGLGWVEEPVPLPLGINPLTLKRCFFVDQEGDPFENQLLYLRKIRAIELSQLQHFLKMGKAPRATGASGSLLKKVETKCPVLGDIFRKARSGRSLTFHEKLTIFFSIGFLPDGKNLIHHILEPCPDYRPQKVKRMIQRVQGKPISCPKIRQLMPERTAYLRCNCSFGDLEGIYPTPILHIRLEKKEELGS